MIHLRFSLSAMLLMGVFAVAMAQAQEEAVFPIEKASIVDADGKVSADLLRYGLSQIFGAPCNATPLKDVKYPENLTPAALYGQIALRTPQGYPGMNARSTNVGGPARIVLPWTRHKPTRTATTCCTSTPMEIGI